MATTTILGWRAEGAIAAALRRRAARWRGSASRAGRGGWRALVAALGLLAAPGVASAQGPPGVVEYYAVDTLGSVRVVFDAAGAVTARSDYLPFGEAIAASGNLPAQRFTGQARDSAEGMDHFNARNLLRTGRFNRVDPIGGSPVDPQSWNRYAYVGNNPLTFTDPTGMLAQGGDSFCSAEFSVDMCGGGDAFSSFGYSDTWGRDFGFGDAHGRAIKAGWSPDMGADLGGAYLQYAEDAMGAFVSKRFEQSTATVALQPEVTTAPANGSYIPAPLAVAAVPVALARTVVTRVVTSLLGRAAAAGVAAGGGLSLKLGQLPHSARYLQGMSWARMVYPEKAAHSQVHHIWPKYLGGPANGPVAPLNSAYHQLITNEFQRLAPYASGVPITPQHAAELMIKVYTRYPLH